MSASDAVDGSHHRHLGAKVQCRMMGRECLLLVNNGLCGHVAGTSAYPPTADIRWPMSAFVPIASALPPGADIRPAKEGPLMRALGRAYEFRRRHSCPPSEGMIKRTGL